MVLKSKGVTKTYFWQSYLQFLVGEKLWKDLESLNLKTIFKQYELVIGPDEGTTEHGTLRVFPGQLNIWQQGSLFFHMKQSLIDGAAWGPEPTFTTNLTYKELNKMENYVRKKSPIKCLQWNVFQKDTSYGNKILEFQKGGSDRSVS